MRVVLAVDGGGSKCDAVVVGEDGRVLGQGFCNHLDPGGGRGPRGCGRSPESVARAVSLAIEGTGVRSLTAVICGVALPPGLLADLGCVPEDVLSVPEEDLGFLAARADAGILVLAGTGAFAFGRSPDGRHLRMDAIGPIVGDNGSAYQIGILALRASARAGWHPRHRTAIEAEVREAVKGWRGSFSPSLSALFTDMLPDRSEVAALSLIVEQKARDGDRVAIAILREAADSMAVTVEDMIDRLGMAAGAWPLIAMGSVATRSRVYWDRLCSRVRAVAPRARPVVPQLTPVLAAALLGLTRLGIADCDELRTRLRETARAAAPQTPAQP